MFILAYALSQLICKWTYFYISVQHHGNHLHHSVLARGRTRLTDDEMEWKLLRGCLSASRPAPDCGLNLNPGQLHTAVSRVFSLWSGKMGGTSQSWTTHWWYTEPVCRCRPKPWIRGQYIYNTAPTIWARVQKPSHYSKLKWKAGAKPKQRCNFLVSTEWIHCRLFC